MLQEDGSVPNLSETKAQTPEEVLRLFEVLDSLEQTHDFEPLPELLDSLTQALRLIAKKSDVRISLQFHKDPHFQKLGISSISSIPNFTDRQLHAKILKFFSSIGFSSEGSADEVTKYFKKKDDEAKLKIMASYADHGLVSLKHAVEMGILQETSSTPGDFVSARDLLDVELSDEHLNLRGYELESSPVNENLFYGRNSFFRVALERGDEQIDRASQLNKDEIENRLRNSMLFVIREAVVKDNRVADKDITEEYIIGRDIQPEEIAYILVDQTNLVLAQTVFKDLPCKIAGVGEVKKEIIDLYEGPYAVPDFENAVNVIVQTEGPVWCHSARLKVDTYPQTLSQ